MSQPIKIENKIEMATALQEECSETQLCEFLDQMPPIEAIEHAIGVITRKQQSYKDSGLQVPRNLTNWHNGFVKVKKGLTQLKTAKELSRGDLERQIQQMRQQETQHQHQLSLANQQLTLANQEILNLRRNLQAIQPQTDNQYSNQGYQ